ncbi:hypothetical protein ONZ45_g14379 [Pleurotus djamor]|nr:hypothetical protein ONZ45_g14379 [Pleurotus djamor]
MLPLSTALAMAMALTRREMKTNLTPAAADPEPEPERDTTRDTIMPPRKPSVSSVHSGYSADRDAPPEVDTTDPPKSTSPDNDEDEDFFDTAPSFAADFTSTPKSRAKRRSKRFSLLPPRLSLTLKPEEVGDELSLWSAAIISAIPSTADEEEFGKKAMIGSQNLSNPSSSLASASSSGTQSSSGTRTLRSGSSSSVYSDDKPDNEQASTRHWQREQDRVLRLQSSLPVQPLSATKKTSPLVASRSPISPSPTSTSSSPSTLKPSPVPVISPGNYVSPGDPTRSVLFDEIMSVVNPSGRSPSSGKSTAYSEPAISEKFSPTLPFSPENARQNAIKFQVNMCGEDLDPETALKGPASRGAMDSTLSIPEEDEDIEASRSRLSTLTIGDDSYDDRRDANRDSSMSTISNVTVTNATIVRSASYATRAVANMEVIAPRSESPPASSSSRSPQRTKDTPSSFGAGKRGELTIGPSALVSGAPIPPPEPSPVFDAYGGLAPSPPNSSGTQPPPPLASVAERMVGGSSAHKPTMSSSSNTLQISPAETKQYPASPQSSHFGSEESSWSGTGSSSSVPRDQSTPTTEVESEPTISGHFKSPSYSDQILDQLPKGLARSLSSAKIISPTSNSSSSPLTPFQRYRGWQHEVVKPLEEFIDDAIDPREIYLDPQEIAEGESGSVYSAHLIASDKIHKLKLPPLTKARDAEDLGAGRQTLVAIKIIPILPGGSPKLVDLRRELKLLKGLWHTHILGMDAAYVDLVDDSLWIRMELMERSLADVVDLVQSGLPLQERMIARFTSDILHALVYLQKHRIAHRDLRSDNLLLNSAGFLKLADFSSAMLVPPGMSVATEIVGVPYWQSPELRSGHYDPLKVDVWSLGATVWEMAEASPPFSVDHQFASRWPPISRPALYSPSFHDFLRLCSEPDETRPDPNDLMKKTFVQDAAGRQVIIHLLSQCSAIEAKLQEEDGES